MFRFGFKMALAMLFIPIFALAADFALNDGIKKLIAKARNTGRSPCTSMSAAMWNFWEMTITAGPGPI